MLTKETPETIKAVASVKHGDTKTPLVLTFHNRTITELTEFMQNPEIIKMPEDRKVDPVGWVNAQACLYLIKSFDDDTDKVFPLTVDGLLEMNSYYPGVLMGLMQLFHQMRQVAVEKN